MLWKTLTIQRFRRLPRDVDTDILEIFSNESSTSEANRYLVLEEYRTALISAAVTGKIDVREAAGEPAGSHVPPVARMAGP